jgi:SPP1 gp7 family putative phage head morphogenesis protein
MNETAEVFMKALLLGMEPEAGPDFADAEPIEILPYGEALAYMRKRLPVEAEVYYTLGDKMRYRTFTASRLADGDAVKRVQGMLAGALEKGEGLREFLKMTEGELADATGMGKGVGWYYETVYRTNMSTAYNVGRAIGFEEVPPVALELIGIDDSRQTEICHSLTVPPFRRPYEDPVWETLWPPFHFNCRTTVRAVYDQAEIDGAGGPDKFYSKGKPDFTPAEGFGTYPVDKTDGWWDLTDSMRARAGEYGLEAEFMEAREKLIESENTPDNAASLTVNEEKVAETLHDFEMSIKDLDHEEGAAVGPDGRVIYTAAGGKHEVDIPGVFIKGNTVTHNHPSGACAPSVNDVRKIIKYDGYGVRTATRDGRFAGLTKGPGGWDKTLAEAMAKEGFDNEKNLVKIGTDRAIEKYGRGNIKTRHIYEGAGEVISEWLEKNAAKYGYIFTRGPI